MRGTVSIKQLEMAHIVAHAKIILPERPRKHYDGTSCGDTLTGVVMPDMADEWRVTWKQKKDLLGKRNLILVGGKGEQHGEEQAAERRPHVERRSLTSRSRTPSARVAVTDSPGSTAAARVTTRCDRSLRIA